MSDTHAGSFLLLISCFFFFFLLKDTVELGQSSGGDKQVDGEQAVVLGDNDKRVSRPDDTGSSQG